MTSILVVRAEPGASATVERARMLGLDPLAAPIFEVEASCSTLDVLFMTSIYGKVFAPHVDPISIESHCV